MSGTGVWSKSALSAMSSLMECPVLTSGMLLPGAGREVGELSRDLANQGQLRYPPTLLLRDVRVWWCQGERIARGKTARKEDAKEEDDDEEEEDDEEDDEDEEEMRRKRGLKYRWEMACKRVAEVGRAAREGLEGQQAQRERERQLNTAQVIAHRIAYLISGLFHRVPSYLMPGHCPQSSRCRQSAIFDVWSIHRADSSAVCEMDRGVTAMCPRSDDRH
eukprot:3806741-Rhodomonas_salina.2